MVIHQDGDSALFLYGIAGIVALDGEALTGVGGGLLLAVSEGSLTALVSSVPERHSLTEPQVADLLSFQQAIAAVHAMADILPARYGCVLASTAELRTHLREKRPAYEDALGRIASCVEMGVRVELETKPEPVPAIASHPMGGADYLRARQAYQTRLQQSQDAARQRSADVAAAFADLAKGSHQQQSRDGTSLTVSFLVPRLSIPAFRVRFAEHSQKAAAREFLLGPWPPFSFSSE